MKKIVWIWALISVCAGASAQITQSALEAVRHMGPGWNIGNTLDSNSGDTLNMWIEWNNPALPSHYETAWGQREVTPELIHMMKEAGITTIRVPITWYPHMGMTTQQVTRTEDGATHYYKEWNRSQWTCMEVDSIWMDRVHQVVDYIINEGLYCIVNVHHDTGASNTRWLVANMDTYNKEKQRFESLWTQIANEFVDYDEHFLFEGYNEMLDGYDSWCFASFAAPGNYNADAAQDAYNAINAYAQSFVNAVRATGGNNLTRNLIVNTYGGCSGEGTWNSHLKDPLTQLQLPTDVTDGHLITEVHFYPDMTSLTSAKNACNTFISNLNTYLVSKGAPVVIGEWGDGSSSGRHYDNLVQFAEYFHEQIRRNDMAAMLWMNLSDGASRSIPQLDDPELAAAMVRGYSNGVTALSNADAQTAEKRIVNGQLLIIREGKQYNIFGQILKSE